MDEREARSDLELKIDLIEQRVAIGAWWIPYLVSGVTYILSLPDEGWKSTYDEGAAGLIIGPPGFLGWFWICRR